MIWIHYSHFSPVWRRFQHTKMSEAKRQLCLHISSLSILDKCFPFGHPLNIVKILVSYRRTTFSTFWSPCSFVIQNLVEFISIRRQDLMPWLSCSWSCTLTRWGEGGRTPRAWCWLRHNVGRVVISDRTWTKLTLILNCTTTRRKQNTSDPHGPTGPQDPP